MSQLNVSIHQAAINALQRWLKSQLPRDVQILSRWPEPNVKLPPKAITILPAGPRQDEFIDPYILSKFNISSTQAQYVWFAHSCTQPLQLDVWSAFDVFRDDLIARLDQALNKGAGATLGGSVIDEPTRHGVLLNLADTWTGTVDCFFNAPFVDDDSDVVSRAEYRATYRGEARMNLTVTAQSARMASITIKQKLSEQPVADINLKFDNTTITNTGSVSHNYGP